MCITTLVSRYRSTYRRVYEGSEVGKRRVRESDVMHRRVASCAQEGSVIAHRRVALYMGGQRDCAQEGSVIHRRAAGCAQEGSVAMAGCHSLLN